MSNQLQPSDRWKADRQFNTRLYLIVLVVGLLGGVILIAISSGSERPRSSSYHTLEIVNTVSGRIYTRKFLNNDEEFAIEFVHSVNNSPVRETFKIAEREIKPVAVRFYSYGAGMPAELEEGQQMSRDGDAIIITGFNRSFTELNYNIGTVSDHLLLINEERISLRDLCGRNALVTLRVK